MNIKRLNLIISILLSSIMSNSTVLNAQTAVYHPLGRSMLLQQFSRLRLNFAKETNQPIGRRPSLPGLRTRNLEILQDGLIRKYPKILNNSPAKARELIVRRYNSKIHQLKKIHQLRGYMAEALYIDKHPDWNYVNSPNAQQHDVTKPGPGIRGEGPVYYNGQIKIHMDGNPSTYARDMTKDYLAHDFIVPDDHVEPLKQYLKIKAENQRNAGDYKNADRFERNYQRVKPLGYSYDEIAYATFDAARAVRAEKYATYTSLGAAIALSMGPTIWDWANGNMETNQALYRLSKSSSVLGAGFATDLILSQIKTGALRGTTRGTVIVGVAVSAVDVTWLVYENGWSQAFYNPVFYEEVGGDIGSITLGFYGFSIGTALASETGPWAPVIGVGFGIITGTVGYVGGRATTRFILEIISPKMLQQQEKEKIAGVKNEISNKIASLKSYSTS